MKHKHIRPRLPRSRRGWLIAVIVVLLLGIVAAVAVELLGDRDERRADGPSACVAIRERAQRLYEEGSGQKRKYGQARTLLQAHEARCSLIAKAEHGQESKATPAEFSYASLQARTAQRDGKPLEARRYALAALQTDRFVSKHRDAGPSQQTEAADLQDIVGDTQPAADRDE